VCYALEYLCTSAKLWEAMDPAFVPYAAPAGEGANP
jgi:hypothetical protein